MKTFDRKEYNKLCAKFVGAFKDANGDYDFEGIDFIFQGCTSTEPLLFDSDWNWIMEVVERIESLGYSFTIGNNHASIWKGGSAIVSSNAKIKQSKKEAVVQAIWNFLNWYYENGTN